MSTRLLYGIMQGYKKSQDDYRKIQSARHKKKQDDELYDIKKKGMKLDLEAKVRTGEMEQVIADQVMTEFKVKDKAHKANSEADDLSINKSLAKTRSEGEKLGRFGQHVANSIGKYQAQQEQPLEASYDKGFKLTRPKAKKRTINPVDKALGSLQAGEYTNRAEAEAEASETLGINWKDVPGAIEIIDNKVGKEKYSIGEIKDIDGKGKWKYLGKDNWEEAK